MGREHVSPQSKEIGLLSLGVDLWFANGQREDADDASFFVPGWRRYDREFRHVEARIWVVGTATDEFEAYARCFSAEISIFLPAA